MQEQCGSPGPEAYRTPTLGGVKDPFAAEQQDHGIVTVADHARPALKMCGRARE
jgi:hypothetical protein